MKFTSVFAGMLAVAVVGAALPASNALAKHGADDRQPDDRGGNNGNRGGGNGSGGGSAKPNRPARPARVVVVELIGRAGSDNAGGIKARARYATRTRATTLIDRRFDVQIENAVPGTAYPITINGAVVGTLTANTLGRAELEFRLNPSADDTDDQPFPAGFPSLVVGDTVSVAGLTITLAARR